MSITLLNAGPGTGKTWTLNHAYRTLTNQQYAALQPTEEQQDIFDYLKREFKNPKKVCFFAFNNSTKDNLINTLPRDTKVQTYHGAGMAAITRRHRFQKLDKTRTDKIISDITGQHLRSMPIEEKRHWLAIKKYVNYLKLEYKTPSQESLDYITLKYPDMSALTMPDSWHQDSTTLLERCKSLTGFIEFVDMLWLGAQSVKQPVYDLGFVDESQDISTCAFNLITRLCKNVVFCGDRNQAIYAFAGASEEMYNTIEKQSDAVLPLLTTQRCPKYICDLANGVRPGGIIHGPNQEQGEHQTLTYDSLPEKIRDYPGPKTLVLSRTNAALVGCALRLHKKGVPCRIINKELSDHVLGFLYQFSTRDIHKLRRNVEAWRDRQGSSRNALWASMAHDQADAAMHLLNRVQTWDDLTALIKETFETHHDGVRLSTIHGAKGLEASNIFILKPPIELPAAMAHPISKEQEINLHFVALTRSNKNLYWVHP